MTSFLGPENPPPLSLVSEVHQRSLQVSKVRSNVDNLFNCGEKYYSQLCKLIRLQSGLNIDDNVCVICSRKSRVAEELEQRLCLLNPVMRLSFGRLIYEEVSGQRDVSVGVVPIDAEDYFEKERYNVKFDKVIIVDGLELIGNRETFLENVKETLKVGVESSLVIVHRTKDMVTLPVYFEAINDIERTQIEVDVLLRQLLGTGYLVGWNIVSLPINIPKEKWLNQLYNHFPPVIENTNTTDIYGGLRELVDTSFKYSEYIVSLKDRFLFLVATLAENISHSTPYKMYLNDEEIESSQDQNGPVKVAELLRLNITPDIKCLLPKNLSLICPFLEDNDPYPEEWWGTMANVPNLGLDRSRVNRYIGSRHKK